MKLFVVGSGSPNPEDWSEWDEVIIVVAKDIEQAKKLANLWNDVTEIPMDKAQVIYSASSPELWYGDDT